MKQVIDCRSCGRRLSFTEWLAHRLDCDRNIARRQVRMWN